MYVAREPEVDVVPTSIEDGAIVAATGVIHQDTEGEVLDLKSYRQKEGGPRCQVR